LATPTVALVTEGAGASSTTHTITFTQTTGDRVVIFFAVDATARTLTIGDSFVNLTNTSATFHIFTKVLDGSEGGNCVITAGVATKSAWLAYNIQGHASGTAPVFSTVATGTSNAPESSTLSPTGGSAQYLWLSAFGQAGEEADDDTWCNSAPSTPGTFTGLVQKTTTTSGLPAVNCEVASAQYASETATVDPGAFDTDQNLAWRAYTVAIYPATATSVYPDCASGTGASYQPVPKPAPSAGHAAGTGTAYEPSRYAMAALALGPVAYWRLGEASGTNADNVQGNASFDGVYVNTPTLGVTGGLTGDADTAITLAAASYEYVHVDRGSFPQMTTDGTLSCWFKLTTVGVAQVLIDDDFNNGPFLYVNSSNQLVGRLGYDDGASASAAPVGSTVLTTGVWYDVFLTFDATDCYIYLNGQQDGAGAHVSVTHAMGTQTAAISFGRRTSYTDLYLDGSLDEGAFWTRALSAAEVQALYVVGLRAVLAGHAAATGSAYQPTISTGKSVDAGLAEATGTAYSPPIKFALVGLAGGTGAANAPPASVAPSAGSAAGAGSAYQPAASLKPNAGVAAATGSAYGPPIKYAPAGLASGTGAAYLDSTKVAPAAGNAAGTGAGNAPVPKPAPSAGAATGTGSASQPSPNPAPNAGSAEGTGSAYPTTMQYALAGAASGTGAGYGASENVAPNAGCAEGIGTAYEPTVETGGTATSVYPDCASGTGDAYSSSTKVNVNVEGGATGTGAAFAPTATVAPSAGAASGTGDAHGPTLTCASNAPAGHASGTGASYPTTMQYALAGHASGTGAAYEPTTKVDPNAGNAAGTGAAYAAVGNVGPSAGAAAGTGSAYEPTVDTGGVPVPVWTTPADTVTMTATPVLAFTIPALASPMHFYLQLDTANTFDTGSLRTHDSSVSQTNWEYWDGGAWVAIPVGGVDDAYGGNAAHYTVTSDLAAVTWYRRIRAGA
jgi:hypothetical protein